MRVASAPVSWGITEIKGLKADLPYGQVMDEIREAGYEGTELGPWGFYPTDPDKLRRELSSRGLSMVGAFVDVPIHDPARFDEGRQAVRQVLPLLSALNAPVLILSAQQTPERAAIAGRVKPSEGLSDEQWKRAGAYLAELARMAHDAGLDATFHHHAGTYVETPQEIERLFQEVDPDLIGLCLDTGHLVFGGGDNTEFLSRHANTVRHLHLKNIDAGVLQRVRESDMRYLQSVRAGVFAPLPAGAIDIPNVIEQAHDAGYDGWMVVEQDVDLTQPNHPDPLQGASAARRYIRETVGI
jgi:inosose dehydratase